QARQRPLPLAVYPPEYNPIVKVGIIGVASSGKSTLFQLLTGASAPAPGGRPEARLGVARVPDPRVDALAVMYQPKKRTPATVEYVDVPGVVKGEGSALVDLPELRGVDALVVVVRAIESDTVADPDRYGGHGDGCAVDVVR